MRPTSAAKHSSVLSLLNEGYSHREIQSRTGVGKGTIYRISNEVDGNKENHPGGRPSKLTSYNKQSIIRQINTGRLDNAVQATQYINSIIPNPVRPQTVRNVLKSDGLYAATMKLANAESCPLTKATQIRSIPSKLDSRGLEKGVVVR